MMKMRAEHAVEQDIARPPVGRVGAVDAFLQLHMTGQAQLGGGAAARRMKLDCTAPVIKIVSAPAAWAAPM